MPQAIHRSAHCHSISPSLELERLLLQFMIDILMQSNVAMQGLFPSSLLQNFVSEGHFFSFCPFVFSLLYIYPKAMAILRQYMDKDLIIKYFLNIPFSQPPLKALCWQVLAF